MKCFTWCPFCLLILYLLLLNLGIQQRQLPCRLHTLHLALHGLRTNLAKVARNGRQK